MFEAALTACNVEVPEGAKTYHKATLGRYMRGETMPKDVNTSDEKAAWSKRVRELNNLSPSS